MTPDIPLDDEHAEAEEAEEADVLVQYEAYEAQNRLWIKAVVPLLQLRPHESQRNVRVQYALDRLQIAACERLVRILSSDLPAPDA
jgi:hypothetical protein